MRCESCGHETEGRICDKCERENLPGAKFCCFCGNLITEAVEKKEKKRRGDPYDIENRVLCSDGNCIGIINENGVCTDCGRPLDGHPQEDA